MKVCKYHLCSNKLVGKQTSYCSPQCSSKGRIIAWRKRTKQRAVDYKGGKCAHCGYNKCNDAFDFHHKDPAKKDFGIAASGHCRSWQEIQNELDKCILLCSNCHRELHASQSI